MAVDTSLAFDPAWPERRSLSPRLASPRAFIAALTTVIVVGLVLPSPAYRARALIAVTDASVPASASALRETADVAVSKSVISDAARSLIGTGYPSPPPSFLERLGLVFGFEWAHPTSADARLAADLASNVAAHIGGLAGTLEISAAASDPAQSAQAATALARALVSQSETMAAEVRRRSEAAVAERLDRLRGAASAARQRFIGLGGTELDPAQARAAAAAQVAVAQARVDALRAIIASGSPPMSDRRDVPSSIEMLQASYLDLSRQLSKALETLGERHTTVISLREEIRSASAALSAEWRRLERVAEADLGTQRERARAVAQADTSAGDARRDAIVAARIAAEVADARVSQAERAARDATAEGRTTRLLSEAAIPTQSLGYDVAARWMLAGLAGLLLLLLSAFRLESRVRRTAMRAPEAGDIQAERSPQRAESEAQTTLPPVATAPADDAAPHLSVVLSRFWTIAPAFGTVASVMVATDEPGVDTASAALTIGRAAAQAGRRVLVIDAAETRPDLAAAADLEAAPVVIDVFGRLRVGLRADAGHGTLYLAPGFDDGAGIASRLVADRATRLLDVVDCFDLLVVDEGLAQDAAAVAWGPDAVVRVATRLSAPDDDRFSTSLGLPDGLMIGTILGSKRHASTTRRDVPPVQAFALAPRPAPRAPGPRIVGTARSAAVARPAQRRKVGAR